MMWTDTTMDKPSMSKAKVGNNYATLHNKNSLLGLTNPIDLSNIWANLSDSLFFFQNFDIFIIEIKIIIEI